MEETFVIWDETCSNVEIDRSTGKPMFLTESEIRRGLGRAALGVLRDGKVRKVYIKNRVDAVPPSLRRIAPAQPYCVKVPVSDTHRAYMHVAERCEAAYDGRPLPEGMSYRINHHCL